MTTVLIVVAVLSAIVILLRLLGSESATRKTMMASYFAAREALGSDVNEAEVLCSVLKTRQPFRTYDKKMLDDIVAMYPDIDSLTAFVISFDKQKSRS